MSSLQVELTVSEVDIPKVSVGQKATVEFDAISGKTFSGTVKSILPNATTSSGVVNYTVYIKLGSIDASLRTGMTATVDIQTLSAANVVTVPNAAVKTSNGTKYVLVVDPSGQSTRKTVTVGVSDDSYTQIASGIAEGTNVSTGSSTAASSGSTTTKRSTGGLFGGPPGGGSGPPAGGPGGN
jgi:RND family efflux transporter MFP subunit